MSVTYAMSKASTLQLNILHSRIKHTTCTYFLFFKQNSIFVDYTITYFFYTNSAADFISNCRVPPIHNPPYLLTPSPCPNPNYKHGKDALV